MSAIVRITDSVGHCAVSEKCQLQTSRADVVTLYSLLVPKQHRLGYGLVLLISRDQILGARQRWCALGELATGIGAPAIGHEFLDELLGV